MCSVSPRTGLLHVKYLCMICLQCSVSGGGGVLVVVVAKVRCGFFNKEDRTVVLGCGLFFIRRLLWLCFFLSPEHPKLHKG